MARFFLSSRIELASVSSSIVAGIENETGTSGVGQYFNGVEAVAPFLSEEGRQFLEGQISAYGSDYKQIYRTQESRQCPDEITIMSPETQIPVIGAFSVEFDAFVTDTFPWNFKKNTYQLRIYEPKYRGHPEHVDYAPGFTISERDGIKKGLTSVSFSLPISWNGGRAPAFRLDGQQGTVLQEQPGSLMIFGPRIVHSHPSAPDLHGQYAWLIAQAFFEFEVDG